MDSPPFSAPAAPNLFACSRFKHAHIAHFQGSPDAELLARESHELLHDLAPKLHGLVKLTAAPPSMSVMDAMPALALQFNRFQLNGVTPADRLPMLRAFMELAQHSTKLNAFPEIKTAFWTTMAHSFMGENTRDVHSPFFSKPEFPQFVIDCGLQWSIKWSIVDESLCDALFEILTTTLTPSTAPVSFGLSFAYDKPTVEMSVAQLELIERMLDRVFSHSGRQHRLTSLDLSNNLMNAQHLQVLARIVAKCSRGVYQIEQVKLDSTATMHSDTTGGAPREYLGIALGAYGVDTLPQFWSFQSIPPAAQSPTVFRSLSLRNNFLAPNYFAAYFATLRYGCQLEADLSDHRRWAQLPHEIGLDTWRWLAFGLFYPRPKRFANQFKLRNLGKLTFGPEAIRTIVNTLRNPVAQLVYNDVEGNDTTTTDCLIVCTLKAGANIEVFASGVEYELVGAKCQRKELWTKTLLETSDFEALCEREDGSVCVVVPGAGLGWVSPQFVESIEREPLDAARSAHDGLYHATLRLGPCQNHFDELPPLFSAIGHQLRSLTFDYIVQTGDMFPHHNFNTPQARGVVMELIRDHCVNLQHLQLPQAPAEDVAVLLDALTDGDLRSRLLTLNVNGSERTFDQAAIVRLMGILGNTANTPALQELRLLTHWIGLDGLASLHEALEANRTLEFLELTRFRPSTTAANLKDHQSGLDEEFQGQLLRSLSPMDVKLAFLSVVDPQLTKTREDQEILGRHRLDQSVLELIFAFASSLETRRVLAWNEEFEFRH